MGDPFPIQTAKIRRPLLRDDVLSRERLNGWLDRAAAGRVALIVADAGFGKTTLLGDWARHSPRCTAWYRLEPSDRDWLTFIRHVVAGGREADPAFAPTTYALLLQVGPGGPTREELTASLATDLAAFGAAAPDGFTLVVDDYHVVDGSGETDPIMRALVDATGPGFSIVIATRTSPKLALGRLRARGGVSRLDGEALCFDVPEADRLFRDAYHHPLEPDVVSDLIDRTEGWAALLSLVHTNLEESKSPDPRALIEQLSTAQGDLFDYLAQEVIEVLPDSLRGFLTHVSLLDHVAETTSALLSPNLDDDVGHLIQQAEELGLLTRPEPTSAHRFHPLVRRFLNERLKRMVGDAGFAAMHLRVAAALEQTDWRSAALHYRAGGDMGAAARVIDSALEEILASGQFDSVRELVDGSAGNRNRPSAMILRSRLELARGSLSVAQSLAKGAVEGAAGTPLAGSALVNLATVLGVSGFEDGAMAFAAQALDHPLSDSLRRVANATLLMWEAGHEGDLSAIAEDLRELALRQDDARQIRYAAITRLNLSLVLSWLGQVEEAHDAACAAQDGFELSAAPDIELGAALAARATTLSTMGRLEAAQALLDQAAASPSVLACEEAALETAKLLGEVGDLEAAEAALDRVGPAAMEAGFGGLWLLTAGQVALRRGDAAGAKSIVDRLAQTPCRDIAGKYRGQLLRARSALATGSPDAQIEVAELHRIAAAHNARIAKLISDVVSALWTGEGLSRAVSQLGLQESYVLSWLAEEIAANLETLTSDAALRVAGECRLRPDRWASALRLALEARQVRGERTAALLAEVGQPQDIQLLGQLSRANKALKPYAAALSHRLAPRVVVRDLGAIRVLIGDRSPVRPIRRKALGLLCFLLTRPGMAATRDEALDALWPELGPDTAANSLHQTIYFLRRVLEPDYREGTTAGYVVFDGDVVTLDDTLVDSSSRECWRLLDLAHSGSHEVHAQLVERYQARFALDFAYDEWAHDYRERLHTAVISELEGGVIGALARGQYELAIRLGQAVLRLEPMADSVELSLVRALKASGRSKAAAEQYAHYAAMVRDQLGVEPTPWGDV
jgi:LuxR family maltose regulon positive regulatory protein